MFPSYENQLFDYRRETSGGREEASLAFFENQKSALIRRKKCPDCVYFWIKYVI